jgi:hypothetical protein
MRCGAPLQTCREGHGARRHAALCGVPMKDKPASRKTGARRDPGRHAAAHHRVLHRFPIPRCPRSGCRLAPPATAARPSSGLQRMAHPRDHPGDLPLSQEAEDIRAAFPGHRHPRVVRSGLRDRARGAGGQRCRDDDRRGRRIHADPGHLPRDPDPQQRSISGLADGIVITPSHNPPHDGGFKYNPPNGGPAGSAVTDWIEARANTLLEAQLKGVKRIPYERALHAPTTHRHDYIERLRQRPR